MRTPHSRTTKGKRVRVKLANGTVWDGRFEYAKATFVVIGGRKIPKRELRAFIPNPRPTPLARQEEKAMTAHQQRPADQTELRLAALERELDRAKKETEELRLDLHRVRGLLGASNLVLGTCRLVLFNKPTMPLSEFVSRLKEILDKHGTGLINRLTPAKEEEKS